MYLNGTPYSYNLYPIALFCHFVVVLIIFLTL